MDAPKKQAPKITPPSSSAENNSLGRSDARNLENSTWARATRLASSRAASTICWPSLALLLIPPFGCSPPTTRRGQTVQAERLSWRHRRGHERVTKAELMHTTPSTSVAGPVTSRDRRWAAVHLTHARVESSGRVLVRAAAPTQVEPPLKGQPVHSKRTRKERAPRRGCEPNRSAAADAVSCGTDSLA